VDPRAAVLLRFRFGGFEHMQNHLHVVDGRTLFFYRDRLNALAAGARAMVEFSFGSSEQVSTLRGVVMDLAEGGSGQSGAWIEFPDARLVRRIGTGEASLSGRHQRRLGCDLLVDIKRGRLPYLGRMVDVSLGGAHILGPIGLLTGSEVELRIIGAKPPVPGVLGRAEVVRSEPGGEVGVRFVRSDSIARIASGKLYAAVQQSWAKVAEVAHSPLCCTRGQVFEPPLPRKKSRL
jgi:hypothetical protein